MENKYHLSTSGKLAKCSAKVRPCPRGHHVSIEGKTNISKKTPQTADERSIYNILYPVRRVSNPGSTAEIEVAKPRAQLSKEQFQALEGYSGMDYYDMNKSLREETPHLSKQVKQRLVKQVKLMDEAFTIISPESPYQTYRGENIQMLPGESPDQAVTRAFFPGSEISRASYVSTSLNPSIAAYFASKNPKDTVSVVLEIKAKTGISLKDIAEATNEEEMLLPRNSTFKVTTVRPFASYQNVEFDEETDYLKPTADRQTLFTIVLEEL